MTRWTKALLILWTLQLAVSAIAGNPSNIVLGFCGIMLTLTGARIDLTNERLDVHYKAIDTLYKHAIEREQV